MEGDEGGHIGQAWGNPIELKEEGPGRSCPHTILEGKDMGRGG